MNLRIPAVPPGGEVIVVGKTCNAGERMVSFSDGSVKKAKASAAYVLHTESTGECIEEKGWAMPELTRDSNVPELHALLSAVLSAHAKGVKHLLCLTDSFQVLQALKKALNGTACSYTEMPKLVEACQFFDSITFQNISRDKNKRADLLCQAHR